MPIRLGRLGASPAAVGLIFTAGSITYGLSAPLVSRASDRLPARKVIIGGTIAMAFALPLLSLARGVLEMTVGFCLVSVAYAFPGSAAPARRASPLARSNMSRSRSRRAPRGRSSCAVRSRDRGPAAIRRSSSISEQRVLRGDLGTGSGAYAAPLPAGPSTAIIAKSLDRRITRQRRGSASALRQERRRPPWRHACLQRSAGSALPTAGPRWRR